MLAKTFTLHSHTRQTPPPPLKPSLPQSPFSVEKCFFARVFTQRVKSFFPEDRNVLSKIHREKSSCFFQPNRPPNPKPPRFNEENLFIFPYSPNSLCKNRVFLIKKISSRMGKTVRETPIPERAVFFSEGGSRIRDVDGGFLSQVS